MFRVLAAIALLTVLCSQVAAQDPQEFWRQEYSKRGPQTPLPQLSPAPQQLSIKDALDPPRSALVDCVIDRMKHAMDAGVPPTDFNRIVDGACSKEAGAFSSAVFQWWLQALPRTVYEANAFSEKVIRNIKSQAISTYTEIWYEAARKRNEAARITATSGTGFFVSDGHVLTNSHVVEDCSQIKIGNEPDARVLARDTDLDLAVLKIERRSPVTAVVRLAPPPRAGEPVVVFGFPLMDLLASSGNATIGNITSEAGIRNDARLVQISAPVQPGNSGGPLLDMRGNVIGVVVSTLGKSMADGVTPQNVNFAIKGIMVANFLDTNHVPYVSTPSPREIDAPAVVELAREFSVPIVCNRLPGTAAAKPQEQSSTRASAPAAQHQMEARVNAFLGDIYSATSAGNATALKFLRNSYADNVTYYGKSLSNEEVIAQLARFLDRWPVRAYRMKEEGKIIRCDDVSSTCTVQGELEFDSRSPVRRERSFGIATFQYKLSFAGQGTLKIIAEGGSIVTRQKQSWTQHE